MLSIVVGTLLNHRNVNEMCVNVAVRKFVLFVEVQGQSTNDVGIAWQIA